MITFATLTRKRERCLNLHLCEGKRPWVMQVLCVSALEKRILFLAITMALSGGFKGLGFRVLESSNPCNVIYTSGLPTQTGTF